VTRHLASAVMGALVAAAALLAGLLPSLLRTGQVAPADWLIPGLLALAVLSVMGGRGAWALRGMGWALAALPAALFMLIAASRVPLGGLALLLGGLAVAAWAMARVERRRLAILGIGLALGIAAILALRWVVAQSDRPRQAGADAPIVAVMTALPLYGPALGGDSGDPLAYVDARAPLWQALERRFTLRPLDALDRAALAGAGRLLLAQPRLLAPEELVALDGWVREGGQALILADPLLHWPDSRPLGDPRRPPLTSLLDPLLAHWGLRLEPNQYEIGADPVERRVLSEGGLLQLAGASRFTILGSDGMGADGTACDLTEGGLVAQCRIGRGSARLIADADWIHDALWTRDPGRPLAASGWTSDAVPALDAWLSGKPWESESRTAWLIDENRLISGLRAAFLLILALACGRAWMLMKRLPAESPRSVIPDRTGNKSGLYPDST